MFGINIGDLVVHIRGNAQHYERMMTKVMKKTQAMARKMQQIGRAMTRYITLPLLALGVASVKTFASFEKQMAEVSTMLDKPADHMKRFSKGILNMSMKFGESTKNLARGLYDVLSATIAPAKALEVVRVATKAGIAGLTDTATAMKPIITFINAYGLKAERAADVSDLLFKIVRRGVTTFGELAPFVGMVASNAALLGVSLEEVGASLSTMTRHGIRSRLAVTALNAVLQTFLNAPKEARETAIKVLGFDLKASTLQAMGLEKVLRKLKTVNIDLLGKLFGNRRAIRALAPLLNHMDGFLEDMKLMKGRTGSAERAFLKMAATLDYQMKRLWQNLKVVSKEIGEVLAPGVRLLANWVMKLGKAFMNLSPTMKKIIVWSGVVLALIGPIVFIIGTITLGIIAMQLAIPFLLATLGAMIPVMIKIVVVGTILAGVFYILKRAWAGFKRGLKSSGMWKDIIKGIQTMQEAFTDLFPHMAVVMVFWRSLLVVFERVMKHMELAFEMIGHNVSTVLSTAGKNLYEIGRYVIEVIGASLSGAWALIKALGMNIWTVLETAGKNIASVVEWIIDAVGLGFAAAWKMTKAFVLDIGKAFGNLFKELWNAIRLKKTNFSGILADFGKQWEQAAAGIKLDLPVIFQPKYTDMGAIWDEQANKFNVDLPTVFHPDYKGLDDYKKEFRAIAEWYKKAMAEAMNPKEMEDIKKKLEEKIKDEQKNRMTVGGGYTSSEKKEQTLEMALVKGTMEAFKAEQQVKLQNQILIASKATAKNTRKTADNSSKPSPYGRGEVVV